MGRPSDYQPEYDDQAKRLCLLGAIDAELAEFFDVSEQTINAWKKANPTFLESLKAGKLEADAKVVSALYDAAIDGDTTAMIFWLKNRRPKNWKDKLNLAGSDGDGPLEVVIRHIGGS